MRRLAVVPVILVLAAGVAGCQSPMLAGGAGAGPAIGGGQGLGLGIIGSANAGPVNMTAGLIGNEVGTALSAADQQAGLAAEYRALQTGLAGSPEIWQGPTAGVSGQVVPGPRYTVNQYECRDYTHTVTSAGISQTARGTACHEPGQPWSAVL